ncbi:TPM domain-containing protein [Metasolibacillus meyeri]|uniref:TPM domain-containing protein n=1 Tax=Metasolibacillus meyeri TaxID=1071052 RepID=UPI000D30D06C|nr:TPM domain-containing protein [Metasolibacillus meyeri]
MSMLKKCFAFFILLVTLWQPSVFAESTNQTQYIFDYANLLTTEEKKELEVLAKELSADYKTAFLILTVDGTDGKGIEQYMGDFYDNEAPGYNKPHGNTVMMSIDMQERDVFLSGFKKGRIYLDAGRLAYIREQITPSLSAGDYYEAFSQFIIESHDYMSYGPDGIIFQWWFQWGVALLLAAIIVGLMAYSSGGKMTTTERDYFNPNGSGITKKHDRYLRTTVTKTKKASSSSGGGSSGGGGTTSGGHSYSGSGGKF